MHPPAGTDGGRVAYDHEGCDYSVEFQARTPRAAERFTPEPFQRHFARKEGWRIDDNGDFCSRHADIRETGFEGSPDQGRAPVRRGCGDFLLLIVRVTAAAPRCCHLDH